MLNARGVDLYYGGAQALYGVDLSAPAGEVTAVLGANGVGKTSLLKALAGAHPTKAGEITLDGTALVGASAYEAARAGVGYVPQGREIFPLLTVQENLETGFACVPKDDRRVPDEVFDLFPVLAEMRNRRGGDLSGGQQQQLAIARAMVLRPKVLLLDEPTEGIQPNIIQQIGRVIDVLRDRGDMAIVLVEQYLDFALARADKFIVLRRGAVTLAGETKSTESDAIREAVSV
ncbi:MAG: urea ABC transporter ATP-binding subunit UrtE [Pseudomonadota bacterium]